MAAANGTRTAAILGRVEKADQPSRSRSLGPAARRQRRVGFWVSVDEVVVAEGEEI